MRLGMIGLGRMGASLVRRLTKDGHKCVVYDVSPAAVKKVTGRSVRGSASIDELVAKLAKPRAVWLMLPAAVAGRTVEERASKMGAGDIIIDGGNSYYRDDLLRAAALERRGIHYVDCGTSGGVFGLERGFCLMIAEKIRSSSISIRSSRASPQGSRERRVRRAGRVLPVRPSKATCTAARLARGTS